MDKKLDLIVNKISNIDISIAKIEVDIKHHIKRTNLLEQQIIPVKTHMDELRGVIKFLKLAGVVIAILEGLRMLHIL